MLANLHLNRLQRKVLLVVVIIIVVPMVVSGFLSAAWISSRVDSSIEQWVREAAQVNRNRITELHHNHRLFAQVLLSARSSTDRVRRGVSPVPASLESLAQELGITLVQVYDASGNILYSSSPTAGAVAWKPEASEAIVRIQHSDRQMLAAVTGTELGGRDAGHYLLLGTLFDKLFLQRLDRSTGLKTRLFYPQDGDFAKAFSEEMQPLRLRLPAEAFAQLQHEREYYSSNAEEGSYFGLYMPLVHRDGRVEAVLFSGLQHRGGDALLTDRVMLTIVLVTVGGGFALIIGFLLSRIIVRPVEYLRQGVLQVAAQDFRADVPIHSKDELGDLANAFNAMAERLREARDAERREFQRDKIAALGELSLAMAHEIRNPIGVINTASQLLEKHRSDPEKQAELVRMLREESMRLNHLLRDFQQLARHRRPEFKVLDPILPLENAVRVTLAGRDDVRVARAYEHGDTKVRADGELLHQAWVNLIRNALDAMGPGPGELQLISSHNDKEVLLAVEDSGPGVPAEMIGRLFEPFFTTKEHGTGLGLTIANTLVQANGGTLELAAPSGRGARFVVRLPISAEGG